MVDGKVLLTLMRLILVYHLHPLVPNSSIRNELSLNRPFIDPVCSTPVCLVYHCCCQYDNYHVGLHFYLCMYLSIPGLISLSGCRLFLLVLIISLFI